MASADPSSSKYVTLISSQNFEFVVLREAVMISPVVKGMLDTRGGEHLI